MIGFVTNSFGWSMDGAGYSLTVRTDRAREIAGKLDPTKRYKVEIREYRKKRSLDQNAMYWSLLTKVAQKTGISNAFAHNQMLRRYGQVERFGDKAAIIVLPDTDEAQKKADEAETYHLKPTSEVKRGKDGRFYRTYLLLRGSSTYDTAEMTRLIDGLVDEAKQVGVELVWEE